MLAGGPVAETERWRLRRSLFVKVFLLLRSRMQDLEQLVQQAGIFSGRAQGTNVSSSTTAAVSELRNVQETAAELYRAFGLACRQHTGHQACLRVRADDAKVDHTTFCLPFRRHGSCKASVAQSKRLTLTIESQSSFKLGLQSIGLH